MSQVGLPRIVKMKGRQFVLFVKYNPVSFEHNNRAKEIVLAHDFLQVLGSPVKVGRIPPVVVVEDVPGELRT